MRWLFRYLIYALAAYALYRLWPARGFVWWTLLASGILMVWTAATHENRGQRPRVRRSCCRRQPGFGRSKISLWIDAGCSLSGSGERGHQCGHAGALHLGDRDVRLMGPDLGNFAVTLGGGALTSSAKSLKRLVGRVGLEPTTTGLKGQCSTN